VGKYVLRLRIPALAIRAAHIRALAALPEFTDPFDRILGAQAIAEGLTLATKDAVLVRYGVLVVWD
jgi:PIN domain nuclease of toxin-antitoxin system